MPYDPPQTDLDRSSFTAWRVPPRIALGLAGVAVAGVALAGVFFQAQAAEVTLTCRRGTQVDCTVVRRLPGFAPTRRTLRHVRAAAVLRRPGRARDRYRLFLVSAEGRTPLSDRLEPEALRQDQRRVVDAYLRSGSPAELRLAYDRAFHLVTVLLIASVLLLPVVLLGLFSRVRLVRTADGGLLVTHWRWALFPRRLALARGELGRAVIEERASSKGTLRFRVVLERAGGEPVPVTPGWSGSPDGCAGCHAWVNRALSL